MAHLLELRGRPFEIIEIISLAGFENYFREVAAAWGDVERFQWINAKYDFDMELDSIPRHCERFGLTFPNIESSVQLAGADSP